MKNNHFIQKLLGFLFFFVLLSVVCTFSIGAAAHIDDAAAVDAGAVARVGDEGTGEYYNSLTEAVAGCPDGGRITLIADTAVSDGVVVDKALTLTGSATVSYMGNGAAFELSDGADLTLRGNIKLQSTGDGIRVASGTASIAIYSGEYAVDGNAVAIYGSGASTVQILGGIFTPCNGTLGEHLVYNQSSAATIRVEGGNAFGFGNFVSNAGSGTETTAPATNLSGIYAAGAPVMQTGAGVRFSAGSNGLRFVSEVDAATLTALRALADEETDISFGTLIFPASYLGRYGSYTHVSLPKYIDIVAKNGLIEDGEGGYIIRAAIVNIKEANLDLDFVGVAYVKYILNGEVQYRYAAIEELSNARSMQDVARVALCDTSEAATEKYLYESMVEAGKYSKYTSSQQATLLGYGASLEAKLLDLILIAGQANTAAFGEEFGEAYASADLGWVFLSGNGGDTLTPGALTALSGNGFELGMAEALADYYNGNTDNHLALLRYTTEQTFLADAASETTWGSWTSPSYLAAHGQSDSSLSGNAYQTFLRLVEQTVCYYERQGYTVNLCGIVWLPGETEYNYYDGIPAMGYEAAIAAPTEEQVNALYTELFGCLVSDLRTDLAALTGADASTIPVITTALPKRLDASSENRTRFVNCQAAAAAELTHTVLLDDTRHMVAIADSAMQYTADDLQYTGILLGEALLASCGHGDSLLAPTAEEYAVEVFDSNSNSLGRYRNISTALNAASTGCTVKLLRDVTLYGTLRLAPTADEVYFDGNGYTLRTYTAEHGIHLAGDPTEITFSALQVRYLKADVDKAAVYVDSASAVTVLGGDFTGINKSAAIIVSETAGAATVVVKDGTYVSEAKATATLENNSSTASITLANKTPATGTLGSYILFGSYPQSSVTEALLLAALNDQAGILPASGANGAWTPFAYYDEDGSITDYMWYQDISHNDERYRGVYFVSYRPTFTDGTDTAVTSSYQAANGYSTGTVYWFRFDPIPWRIVTGESGSALLICELAIDSGEYCSSKNNSYAYSTIREWLQDSFYELAFSSLEQALVVTTSVDNSAASTGYDANGYAGEATEDRVFLLSGEEIVNEAYGFDSDMTWADTARQKEATAYALCQGVYVNADGNASWWLRSPANYSSDDVRYVLPSGTARTTTAQTATAAYHGVVPAVWIILE